jgi:hypothetical protein
MVALVWNHIYNMISITNTIETKQYGSFSLPVNAYSFGRMIAANQTEKEYKGTVYVLFNKGRYFEATVYKSIIDEVSELTGIDISFKTMIVGSWNQLEDFVIALNCLGYYAEIEIDWI